MPSHLVSRRMIRAASALALGAALAVPTALAGTASAVTSSATAAVNSYGWQLTYTAASNQTNSATVTESFNSDHTEFTYVIDLVR